MTDELVAKRIHLRVGQFVFGLIDGLAFEIDPYHVISGSTE